MRLVNAPTAKRIPSTRLRLSACDETSIAQARSPPSTIRRKVCWSSIASGVVRSTGSDDPADDPLDGAHQARLNPLALEDVADQEGGRGLAVGAGDAGDAQLLGRVAVEAHRGVGHRRAGLADLDLDHARVEIERALDDNRRGPGLHRVGRELVAVGGEPGDAEEQRPGARLAAVVGKRGDLGRGIAGDLHHVGACE